jgi:phosphoglycerate kinase
VAELLPHAAGFLVEREYQTLEKLITDPDRPFVAIIGGAKVSTKIDVLSNLIGIVDGLVIAGAMANTFLTALGHDMGSSILEKDYLTQAKQIYYEAMKNNIKLVLPSDFLVAKKIDGKADAHLVNLDQIGPKELALDVGPKSSQDISILVDQAKTIFWNGPLGYTEIDRFAAASIDLANTMIESSAQTIIGGGDSAAFVDKYHLSNKFDFVSTGGGASLELLAGKNLPGIEVLQS